MKKSKMKEKTRSLEGLNSVSATTSHHFNRWTDKVDTKFVRVLQVFLEVIRGTKPINVDSWFDLVNSGNER